jgi:hypothetical protein
MKKKIVSKVINSCLTKKFNSKDEHKLKKRVGHLLTPVANTSLNFKTYTHNKNECEF